MHGLHGSTHSFASEMPRGKTCCGGRVVCVAQQPPPTGMRFCSACAWAVCIVHGQRHDVAAATARAPQHGAIQGNLRNLSRYGMLVR